MENPKIVTIAVLIDFDFANPEKSFEQASARFRELADISDKALSDIRRGEK